MPILTSQATEKEVAIHGSPDRGRQERRSGSRVGQIRGPGDAGLGSGTYHAIPDRRLHPEETIARVKRFATAFGITRVANLTGLDRTGIPVVMVCRPNARSTAVFHGKGIDLAAAKASGLMEAIETWHAEHIQLPIRFASYSELGKEVKIADLDLLPRIPDSRF